MKAAIVNPYLDTLGGGERYSLSVAMALVRVGYKVDVEWEDESIKKKLEERFGMKLADINVVVDVKRGDGYDVCFWVSDGSIPTLRARKNLLHFQFPFRGVRGKTLINRMKLFRVSKIICNSKFTKDVVDQEYGFSDKSVVVYPPVDIKSFRPKKKKENIILYVGRFSALTQSKRQDVLVDVFKKLYREEKAWKLVLAGGIEVGVDEYFDRLKKAARGYPIEIVESPGFEELKDLFGRAKIFWSASGYGVEEKKDPVKVEHFGITLVEAMSAGVAPMVYAAGGHKEIVKDGENGFLWREKSELLNKTIKLVSDKRLLRELTKKAKEDSEKYSYERFEKEFLALL